MEFNAMMPVVVPALLAPAFAALVIAAFVNASSLPAVAAVPPSPPAVVNAVLCPASAGFSIGAKANEKDSSAREESINTYKRGEAPGHLGKVPPPGNHPPGGPPGGAERGFRGLRKRFWEPRGANTFFEDTLLRRHRGSGEEKHKTNTSRHHRNI